jgi:hypothetical protein
MVLTSEENNAILIKAATDAVMTALITSGAVKAPKAKRERVNWERLLMYEYVAKTYGNIPHWFRIEVGPIPNGGKNPIYARTRRWADAIIRMPDGILIIEGKMKAKPDVVSQLLNYRQLFPLTPLFQKYKDEPIELKLVVALIDDETKTFVENAGIEVEVFRPSNFEEWYRFTVEKDSTPLPKVK